jgi:TorA maturation chaperone TorD
MGALIVGRLGKASSLNDQKSFYNKHIGPWAGHFFTDLEGAKKLSFIRICRISWQNVYGD